MRITCDSRKENTEQKRRKLANEGCDKCPCCGETKYFYISEDKQMRGISAGMIRTETKIKGFFNLKIIHRDCYSCYTCGSKWESDEW